jgi:aspartate beta-hydroxylase
MSFDAWFVSDAGVAGMAADSKGHIHLTCHTGVSLKLEEADDGIVSAEVFMESGGAPNALGIDRQGVVFLGDYARKSLLEFTPEEGVSTLVDNYDEGPLLGPSAITVHEDGVLYFTDGGMLGDTTLAEPTGTLYSITGEDKILFPMLTGLAGPSGVAVVGRSSSKVVYVAETLHNRILRGVQYPPGVFHFSVFKNFAGGLGPGGIAVDASTGNLYVLRRDVPGIVGAQGYLTILSRLGRTLDEITTPAPLLKDIVICNGFVYVSESSTKTVYRTRLL